VVNALFALLLNGQPPDDSSVQFQSLLFGDDSEAQAQEAERVAYAEARKIAWDEDRPFPEDTAKWYAAHREFVNKRSREHYRQTYSAVAHWALRSAARFRAVRLGCKIGKRGPILKVYRKAIRDPIVLCYWCKNLTLPGDRHVDHKVPLAAGGAHVAGNLCIACIECNLSKGDSSPVEFRKAVAEKRKVNSIVAANHFRRELSLLE